jgi:hypothetical protein
MNPAITEILAKHKVPRFEAKPQPSGHIIIVTDNELPYDVMTELTKATGIPFVNHLFAINPPNQEPVKTGAPSMVNHPAHYNSGKYEVIEVLEDWKLEGHEWNVVKYIARAGKKDPSKRVEDLEKGAWYLARKIELLKAAKEGRDVMRPNDMNPRQEYKVPVSQPQVVAELHDGDQAFKLIELAGEWVDVGMEDGRTVEAFLPKDSLGNYGVLRERIWVGKKI